MNYVAHTRAAHEHLSRQAQARSHHVSLYWALFFEWNAARFPAGLDLDHLATMRAARIGNERTYRAALYDLDTWQLLAYQPSQSRYGRSRCFLTDLSQPPATGGTTAPDEPAAPGPKVAPINPGTTGTSAPDAAQPSEAELPPMHPPIGSTSALHEKGASGAVLPQALRAQVPPMRASSEAEVPEDTLYGKTKGLNSVVVNGGGSGTKKKLEVLENEGLSGVEMLDAPESLNNVGPAQKKASRPKPGTPEKGVAGASRSKSSHKPRQRTILPELTFSQSVIARADDFIAAFQGTDYQLADLRHYHQLVATWRDKKTGLEPTRKDWIATAKRFMLNDAADNRLKLAPKGHAGPITDDPGAFFARTGFRSRYDS